MRYTALIFVVVFIVFAIVQYNDPDALLWIAIYVLAAAISILAFYKKSNKVVLMLALAGSLIGALGLFPYGHFEGVALHHGMKTLHIELARESLGLGLIFLSMIFFLLQSTSEAKSVQS